MLSYAHAREAAFLSPGAAQTGEAVRVDPRPEIDVGEIQVGMSKKTTIFFVNQVNVPITVENISISSDSIVNASEVSNDCTKQGVIAPLSRCSVELSIMPTASGTWSISVVLTHGGAGRIVQARVYGRTGGLSESERIAGLIVSGREIKPIDFGTVDLGAGRTVRTTLMVNNTSEPIILTGIDLIEADNGLYRLETGCEVGLELMPGASCPITVMWEPRVAAPVSTDLIVRNTGKLGFVVIPIRGVVKTDANRLPTISGAPLPPSVQDLEGAMFGKLLPVSEPEEGEDMNRIKKAKKAPTLEGGLRLIGNVGQRAILLLPSGNTAVVDVGAGFETDDGYVKLIALRADSAEVMVDNTKRIVLRREAAASLVGPALQGRTGGSNSSPQSKTKAKSSGD
ncbi:MAG: choice-of-anchor D domain-containing protein [Alphaproteobacteria bacterium]|nr:choice-of-anchor D domain-containing protein [Alphaproteobacteria bacterium]